MKTAIVTLAVGDYLVGARVLFDSLAKHGLPDSVERVVIGVDSCDFAQAVPVSADYSEVSINKAIFPATENKFFSLTLPYDRVVMLDSDMLCIGDCSLLWSEHIKNLPFYACRDTAARFYYGDKIVRIGLDHMRILNSGMFVYNRNLYADLHADLLAQITAGIVESYDGADQGYFNHFFQKNAIEIGWLPGGLNYCLDLNMPQLPEAERRLIHFTGLKPWRGSVLKSSPMFPYYERWIKAEKSLSGENVVESITDTTAESPLCPAAAGNSAELPAANCPLQSESLVELERIKSSLYYKVYERLRRRPVLRLFSDYFVKPALQVLCKITKLYGSEINGASHKVINKQI